MDYKPGPREQVFCPNCKGGNPPNAQRCMWCSAALHSPQQGYTPPPLHPAEMQKPPASSKAPTLIGVAVLLLVVFVVVAFFILNRPSQMTGTGPVYKMNEAISIARWKVTVEKTELTSELIGNASGDRQAAAGQYLKVYMAVENVTGDADVAKTSEYTILDGNIGIYPHCNTPGCLAYPEREQRVSLNREIPPRTTHKVLAIFDISRDASGLRLEIRGAMERDKFVVVLDR